MEADSLESIGRYSAAVYRLAQSILGSKLKHLEIGSGQYDIFLIISRHEGISQKEICDRLYIEKSTTAKAVKFLRAKDYIYNKPIDNDKRYSSLYLTEKGHEASVEVEAVFSEILGVFTEDIPESMMAQSISVLKKVISNLQAEKSKYVTE